MQGGAMPSRENRGEDKPHSLGLHAHHHPLAPLLPRTTPKPQASCRPPPSTSASGSRSADPTLDRRHALTLRCRTAPQRIAGPLRRVEWDLGAQHVQEPGADWTGSGSASAVCVGGMVVVVQGFTLHPHLHPPARPRSMTRMCRPGARKGGYSKWSTPWRPSSRAAVLLA